MDDNKRRKYRLPFHKELLITITSLFLLFVMAIFSFQYSREKEFRKQLLNAILQSQNEQIYNALEYGSVTHLDLDSIIDESEHNELRISIFSASGEVLAESSVPESVKLPNHSNRPEFIQAIREGTGYSLRYSNTLHQNYFYSTQKVGDLMVRSALPFSTKTVQLLKTDNQFVYFLLMTSALVILTLIYFCSRLGKSISVLQEFSNQAEQDQPINTFEEPGNNDIGNITRNIMRIYQNLRNTKEELSIEKEKLIKHLQFSNEGLAVFSENKQKILANNLFIQYINLISDREITQIDQVFYIEEFEQIFAFINSNQEVKLRLDEYLSKSLTVSKNGKSFQVACYIFQDNTFEISINNITQKEEESRLKRQLTQNIAHELKTPVSSIQGYMETIIDNAEMPREKRQQFLERCYAQTIRLTGLLRDISLLNRIDEADTLFDHEVLNLSNIVNEIANESTVLLENKGMSIELKMPPSMPIHGNYSLLYSIFRNLTDNAMAYAGEGTKINIHCYLQDREYYYFSFADNGMGVQEEHLNRLFERFYRVDKGRSRKVGGTGLGLAIVKNAVLFHRGEILAKNRAQGGLEFLFTLKK